MTQDVPPMVTRDLLARAIAESRDGITISDAQQGQPHILYANPGFEQITGYTADEVLGKSYGFLQGPDTDGEVLTALRNAVESGESCQVVLRNYRKDGAGFWNELGISPVRDPDGQISHFIGICRDVTATVLLENQLKTASVDLPVLTKKLHALVNTDPLVGISNRHHFDQRFSEFLSTAQRTHSDLSVLLIDIDRFVLFNERYGRRAGDECLRMIGDRLAKSFARASDCVARFSGAVFSVVSMGTSLEDMQQHAQKLCGQVRALNIPHGDSPNGVVTVSVGGVARVPHRETQCDELLKIAEVALYDAKHRGRDQIRIVS